MPLLEREGELERLDRILADALTGRGSVLLLEGEAGAGKTSLLSELRDRARERDFKLLVARGGQLEQGFAYGCARQLLEAEVALATPERRATLTLGAAQHAIVPLGGTPAGEGSAADEGDAELRALHGLHWLVVNLADEGPLTLVLDDAHWADEASLRWLAYLARRAEELPLVLAVAARPEAPPGARSLLDELADGALTTVLRPRPLTAGAIAVLAADELRATPEPAFVDAALRITGGNPFFVRELLRAARDEGLKPRGKVAAQLEQLGPDRVAPAVARRVEAAGPDAAAVARALAVLDASSPMAQVAAVAGIDADAALAGAGALARAGVLESADDLDFVHPIVRAAVLERLDLDGRAALHVRAASALAAAGGDVERVAAHLHHVPPGTQMPGGYSAWRLLLRAAKEAQGRGANDTAAEHLRRALQEPLAEEDRIDATLSLARTELQRRSRDAFTLYEAALDAIEDVPERAQVALELVHGLSFGGEFREAVAMASRALEWDGLPEEARVALECELVSCGLMELPHSEATIARVSALLDRTDTGRPLHPMERSVLGHALVLSGRAVPLGVELCLAAIRDPRVDQHHGGVAMAAIHGLIRASVWAELEELLGERLERGRRAGSRRTIMSVCNLRSMLRLARGDLLGAESDTRTVFELTPPDEVAQARAWLLAPAVVTLCARGEVADARALLDQWAPPEPWPRLYQFALLHHARAELALAEERPAAALRDALAAGEVFGDTPLSPEALPWRSTAAEAHLALGDRAAARALATDELEAARACGIPQALGRALTTLARASEPGEATELELLHQAVAVLEGADAELTLARARVELGAALRRAGKRVAAREMLREGVDGAARCGAVPLAARGREELLAAGARPRRERLGGVEALTASERRVVELAAGGATNRDIAQALFLTQKTVETHLSSAYRKLDISSRRQLGEALGVAAA